MTIVQKYERPKGSLLYSSSSARLAHPCPASHAIKPRINRNMDPARDGTEIHGGALLGLPVSQRNQAALEKFKDLPRGEPEIAYAWANGTSQRIGRLEDARAYPEGTEIAGTCDLVHVADGSAEIWDLKTGKGAEWTVQPPWENDQLKTLAMLVADAHLLEEVHVGLIPSTGIPTPLTTITAADLDTERERAQRTGKAILAARAQVEAGITPETYPGSHCEYCPVMRACPSFTGLIRQATAEPETVVDKFYGYLADGELAKARLLQKMLNLLAETFEDEIKPIARQEAIDLLNGKFYGKKTKKVPKYDTAISVRVVAAHTDMDTALKAASLSAASITRAVGDEKAEEVLEAIEKAGGVKTIDIEEVREFSVKGKTAA